MKKLLAVLLSLLLVFPMTMGFADGETTYVGEAQGFGGKVTAYVTVDADGNMTDLQVIGPDETIGRGSVAIEEMPSKIVEANSVDVDGTSGATFTSQAIRDAVTAALEGKVAGSAPEQQDSFSFTPGTYTASAFAHNFPLSVEVVLSENRIESVTITEDKSDVAMARAVSARIPTEIVEQQSLNVDAVSGATESSNAVINAVAECVEQASNSETVVALKSQSRILPKVENLEFTADVAVVGGGGSGLTAAYSLTEQGYSVVVMEAADIFGGMSNVCGGGSLSFGSTVQNDAGVYESADEAAALQDAEYDILLAAADGQANAAFLHAYVDALDEYVDWAMSAGIEYSSSNKSAARLMNKGARFDAIMEKMTAKGATLLSGTRGTTLLTDASGAVVGVVGTNATGGTTTVHSRAVLIATGGFLANNAMVQQYLPFDSSTWENWSGSVRYQGDGIQMAWNAGAAVGEFGVQPHDDQVPEAIHKLGLSTHSPVSYTGAAYYPSLWVNSAGKRFINEAGMGAEMHGAVTMYQGVYYTILDQSMIDRLETEGSPIGGWMSTRDKPLEGLGEQIEKVLEAGYCYRADSIEELAACIGADAATLSATVERYNQLVADGADTDFGKAPEYLDCSIENGPFYAFTNVPRILAAYGGLDIDENMSVLDAAGNAVPGLFAAGLDAGSFMGNVYSVTTTTAGFAICSGYMAGNGIGEYLAG